MVMWSDRTNSVYIVIWFYNACQLSNKLNLGNLDNKQVLIHQEIGQLNIMQ